MQILQHSYKNIKMIYVYKCVCVCVWACTRSYGCVYVYINICQAIYLVKAKTRCHFDHELPKTIAAGTAY